MFQMNGYLIALIIFLAWIALVMIAKRMNWLEKRSMSLFGPIIMWRTRKGREFIERLSSAARLWTFFGKASLWICAGAMVTMMVLLLWEATIVSQVEKAPSPELILGVPGINPIIPVGYGILGLAVAMVAHEFAHGIMTRRGNMNIKSLGLLFLVFPIGAFVEPDEKQLETTTRAKRSKVFAAGPASNLILALVTLGIFSGVLMASVVPSHEGTLVQGVVPDSPVDIAGITSYSVIHSVGGEAISSPEDMEDREATPGSLVSVGYRFGGEATTVDVVDGLVVSYTVKGYAADEAGLDAGMVLVSLNDVTVLNIGSLRDIMGDTTAGQTVNVTVMRFDEFLDGFVVADDVSQIQLYDKGEFYAEFYPAENDPSYYGTGFLCAGFLMLGAECKESDYIASGLANPFRGDESVGDFSMSWLRLIALPFLELAPLRSPVTDLYEPSGSLDWMPDSAFWMLTNAVYWIFWLNLMLGLTNVLPAVPLDGGYLFRDGMDFLLTKVKRRSTKEERERIVGSITMALALLVLSLILWQLVGPRL
jgi:membrane-associated protease RseP (regulator of RpoE activity)